MNLVGRKDSIERMRVRRVRAVLCVATVLAPAALVGLFGCSPGASVPPAGSASEPLAKGATAPASVPSEPASSVAIAAAPSTTAPAEESEEVSDPPGPCEPNELPNSPDGPFPFEQGDRYGYKDKDGNVVIGARFQAAYEFNTGGVGTAVLDNHWVFISKTGRVLAQAYMFDNGPDYFIGGYARIVKDGKMGFIDQQGTIAVAPAYPFAGTFCEERAPVCSDCVMARDGEHQRVLKGHWGFIDPQGNVVVPMVYDEPGRFENGEATLERNGVVRVVDKNGVERAP